MQGMINKMLTGDGRKKFHKEMERMMKDAVKLDIDFDITLYDEKPKKKKSSSKKKKK